MEKFTANPSKIEGELELNGTKYPVMVSQPLARDFKWDDAALSAELYDFVLNDLGHSPHLTLKC